jgi:5-methylcytosine-specific restriction protein A
MGKLTALKPTRPDQRSAEAEQYRKLYDLAAWRGSHGARQAQLKRQPLCENCLKHGRITAATVVDHKTPHKGDLELFLDPNNHQSLCDDPRWRCHSSDKQREEHGNAPRPHIGIDGWPTT